MHKEDVLNAILTDLVADQILRAVELGFSEIEIKRAVHNGMAHGFYESSRT